MTDAVAAPVAQRRPFLGPQASLMIAEAAMDALMGAGLVVLIGRALGGHSPSALPDVTYWIGALAVALTGLLVGRLRERYPKIEQGGWTWLGRLVGLAVGVGAAILWYRGSIIPIILVLFLSNAVGCFGMAATARKAGQA